MLISSVEKFYELLKSKPNKVIPVLFLTPDYPVSDFEALERIIDDPTVVVFDLTEATIDVVQVIKIPQLRFYYKAEVVKKFVGGDIYRWQTELLKLEETIRKEEQEVLNERASVQQKRTVAVNRKENADLSGAVCFPLSEDEKRAIR